jgi:hypothetical protein
MPLTWRLVRHCHRVTFKTSKYELRSILLGVSKLYSEFENAPDK